MSVCVKGISGEAVECILIEDAPEAERICVGVTAMEKISVICATWVLRERFKKSRSTYHHRWCD